MDRWWDDPDAASGVLVSVTESPDPVQGVGSALLGYHAHAKAALAPLASSTLVDRRAVADVLAGLDCSPVVKAVSACVEHDLGPASQRFADLLVSDVHSRASSAADRMLAVLVNKGVPWPAAVDRVASVVGVSVEQAGRYVSSMSAPVVAKLSQEDAADRALMEWASAVSKALPVDASVSKAERERSRTAQRAASSVWDEQSVSRDELGRFADQTEGERAAAAARRERRKARRARAASRASAAQTRTRPADSGGSAARVKVASATTKPKTRTKVKARFRTSAVTRKDLDALSSAPVANRATDAPKASIWPGLSVRSKNEVVSHSPFVSDEVHYTMGPLNADATYVPDDEDLLDAAVSAAGEGFTMDAYSRSSGRRIKNPDIYPDPDDMEYRLVPSENSSVLSLVSWGPGTLPLIKSGSALHVFPDPVSADKVSVSYGDPSLRWITVWREDADWQAYVIPVKVQNAQVAVSKADRDRERTRAATGHRMWDESSVNRDAEGRFAEQSERARMERRERRARRKARKERSAVRAQRVAEAAREREASRERGSRTEAKTRTNAKATTTANRKVRTRTTTSTKVKVAGRSLTQVRAREVAANERPKDISMVSRTVKMPPRVFTLDEPLFSPYPVDPRITQVMYTEDAMTQMLRATLAPAVNVTGSTRDRESQKFGAAATDETPIIYRYEPGTLPLVQRALTPKGITNSRWITATGDDLGSDWESSQVEDQTDKVEFIAHASGRAFRREPVVVEVPVTYMRTKFSKAQPRVAKADRERERTRAASSEVSRMGVWDESSVNRDEMGRFAEKEASARRERRKARKARRAARAQVRSEKRTQSAAAVRPKARTQTSTGTQARAKTRTTARSAKLSARTQLRVAERPLDRTQDIDPSLTWPDYIAELPQREMGVYLEQVQDPEMLSGVNLTPLRSLRRENDSIVYQDLVSSKPLKMDDFVSELRDAMGDQQTVEVLLEVFGKAKFSQFDTEPGNRREKAEATRGAFIDRILKEQMTLTDDIAEESEDVSVAEYSRLQDALDRGYELDENNVTALQRVDDGWEVQTYFMPQRQSHKTSVLVDGRAAVELEDILETLHEASATEHVTMALDMLEESGLVMRDVPDEQFAELVQVRLNSPDLNENMREDAPVRLDRATAILMTVEE